MVTGGSLLFTHNSQPHALASQSPNQTNVDSVNNVVTKGRPDGDAQNDSKNGAPTSALSADSPDNVNVRTMPLMGNMEQGRAENDGA